MFLSVFAHLDEDTQEEEARGALDHSHVDSTSASADTGKPICQTAAGDASHHQFNKHLVYLSR